MFEIGRDDSDTLWTAKPLPSLRDQTLERGLCKIGFCLFGSITRVGFRREGGRFDMTLWRWSLVAREFIGEPNRVLCAARRADHHDAAVRSWQHSARRADVVAGVATNLHYLLISAITSIAE